MRSRLSVALLALLPSVARAQEARVLSSAEMSADLFLLTETLTSQHSGLMRYTSRKDIEEAFGGAALAVEEGPRDALWFYREVSALIAHVRCGHTRVRFGERDRAAALARRGLLPFEVWLSGARAWILRVLDDELPLRPAQEVLAIDGLSISQIRERAFPRMSGDGLIGSGKERELEAEFAELFTLLVAESRASEYELELAGEPATLRVKGLAPQEFQARRGARPDRPLVRLELFPESVGWLSIAAFGDPPAGQPRFPEQLEASFRKLRDEKIAHLVLDLRGNGGGRDQYGARLVSYLSSKPFGYFERIEVTADYSSEGEIEERDGRRLMLSHSGLQVQQPQELHFQGDVRILIDGFTFSTAADAATVAHANRLAKFYGEETGGGYEGNNSGETLSLVLKNSALSLSVPQWNYTTAGVGSEHHGRGVVPDVEVRATIEDVLAGRDAVLERALEDIRALAPR